MGSDLGVAALLVGLTVTIALWAFVLVRRPEMRGLAARGAGVALLVAAIIGLVAILLITLVFNGRPFLFGSTLSLAGAFTLGLIGGGVLAGGFLWINLLVLAVGLWFRPGEGWAVGATLATPVVIAALGFGYGSFTSYQYQSTQPRYVPGTFAITVDGTRRGHATAAGQAPCGLLPDGSLRLDANAEDTGQPVDVQFGLSPTGEIQVLAIAVGDVFAGPGKGWEIGSTTAVVAGSSRESGQITFHDIVPLDGEGLPDPIERWSGSLSWTCTGT